MCWFVVFPDLMLATFVMMPVCGVVVDFLISEFSVSVCLLSVLLPLGFAFDLRVVPLSCVYLFGLVGWYCIISFGRFVLFYVLLCVGVVF